MSFPRQMDLTAVRGMLFEEAVLFLLRLAGYEPVTSVGTDRTLRIHSAGMGISVVGRGAPHQIDAIADYRMGQPFSHPQRLLVEAKCYTNRKAVDLETTRNAVGVLKDVSEFWATVNGMPADHRRYHYQKAIFSATSFTAPAESYAFAHDIYLFPMGRSSCFSGLLSAIFAIRAGDLQPWARDDRPMRSLRLSVREFLGREPFSENEHLFGGDYGEKWVRFGHELRRLGGVVLALVGRSFPLFLVPTNRGVIGSLRAETRVRIRWASSRGWTITDIADNVLFSFDLPPVLFYMYAGSDTLTRAEAATLKEDIFKSLHAMVFDGDQPRVVSFVPDPEWFANLRNYAKQSAEGLIPAEGG
jgi:hypothetical protein